MLAFANRALIHYVRSIPFCFILLTTGQQATAQVPESADYELEFLWRTESVEDRQDVDWTGPYLALSPGPNGTLVVVDVRSQSVVVLDRTTGRFVRAISRHGQGPAELYAPVGVRLDESDRIWIANAFMPSYQLFDSLGTFLDRLPRAGMATSDWVVPLVNLRGGGFLDEVGVRRRWFALHVGEDGSQRDSLFVRETPQQRGIAPEVLARAMTAEGAVARQEQAIKSRMLVRSEYWARGGPVPSVWMVPSDEVHLMKTNFAGDTVVNVIHEHRPIPLSREEQDWIDVNRRARPESTYGPNVVLGLFPMADGRLLLFMGRSPFQTDRLRLFGPDGSSLGIVSSPHPIMATPSHASLGDTVFVSGLGDFDIPWVGKAVLRRVH